MTNALENCNVVHRHRWTQTAISWLISIEQEEHLWEDTLPEWSKGVDPSSTSASCVGSNPTGVMPSLPGGAFSFKKTWLTEKDIYYPVCNLRWSSCSAWNQLIFRNCWCPVRNHQLDPSNWTTHAPSAMYATAWLDIEVLSQAAVSSNTMARLSKIVFGKATKSIIRQPQL